MADEINKFDQVKMIERCEVAPPPHSVPSTTLPLTFFDIPWFFCRPIKRIFFYEFRHPTNHFLQTALPILKHSLSLSLQHFFPFAANLIAPPQLHLSHIRYLPGDSLSFTVAESTHDFTLLTSDSPQDAQNWHPLIPTLFPPRVEQDGTRVFPLMAIQVTLLPHSGFTISLTLNHLAGDGKSLHHFVKFWASLCKARAGSDMAKASLETPPLSLPSHDRDKVKDPKGLKRLYFQELEHSDSKRMEFAGIVQDFSTDKVRSTFALTREQIEKLKKWFSVKRDTLHTSTFVVTCSLVWVCMIMLEENKGNCVDYDELCYLVFLADCRDLPEFSLPRTYFGNCLASCTVAMKRSELVAENGIVGVANAIEKEVRDVKSDALRNAGNVISNYRELGKPDKSVLIIAGSPKLGVYESDFGWGKPKKSEAAHIESSGFISLSDCRDGKGGIEVGLALERFRMNEFFTILQDQLHHINKF